jgi:hypothetical protein
MDALLTLPPEAGLRRADLGVTPSTAIAVLASLAASATCPATAGCWTGFTAATAEPPSTCPGPTAPSFCG